MKITPNKVYRIQQMIRGEVARFKRSKKKFDLAIACRRIENQTGIAQTKIALLSRGIV